MMETMSETSEVAFQRQRIGNAPEKPVVSITQVFLLGLAMRLGGCTIAWNYGYAVGFWEYFIAVIVIGMGYLCLGICMAEMVSIISFDGGYYGYARVTMGPFGGFLVGCSGLIESLFYFAIYPLKIAQFLQVCFEIPDYYLSLTWFCIYVGILLFHLCINKYFWQVITIYATLMSIFVGIYLFGTMPDLDFAKYAIPSNAAQSETGFSDDPFLFFNVFRLSILFFIGFDLLTLISSEVKDSKRSIPYAMLALIMTMLVLAIWLLFTAASQEPGVSKALYGKHTYFPLVFGYQRIFNVSYRTATAISVLPSFGTCIAYVYIIGRQMKAMASSGLLPFFLTYTITFKTTITKNSCGSSWSRWFPVQHYIAKVTSFKTNRSTATSNYLGFPQGESNRTEVNGYGLNHNNSLVTSEQNRQLSNETLFSPAKPVRPCDTQENIDSEEVHGRDEGDESGKAEKEEEVITTEYHVPIVAYLCICLFGFGANHYARAVSLQTTSSRTATIAGCFVYLSMFYCYIIFDRRYGHMERMFKNPFGYIVAVIGAIIFSGVLVILLCFDTEEFKYVTIFYFSYIGLMSLYYFSYVERHQYFSESEQKVFFKAYIMNMRRLKKKTWFQRLLLEFKGMLWSLSLLLCRSGWCCSPPTATILPNRDEDLSPRPELSSSQATITRDRNQTRTQRDTNHDPSLSYQSTLTLSTKIYSYFFPTPSSARQPSSHHHNPSTPTSLLAAVMTKTASFASILNRHSEEEEDPTARLERDNNMNLSTINNNSQSQSHSIRRQHRAEDVPSMHSSTRSNYSVSIQHPASPIHAFHSSASFIMIREEEPQFGVKVEGSEEGENNPTRNRRVRSNDMSIENQSLFSEELEEEKVFPMP